MNVVKQAFEERRLEIDEYLKFLEALQIHAQSGTPRIGETPITQEQQKILYSSLYLQLYNLIEATANWCLEAVGRAIVDGRRWTPFDLAEKTRREWVRAIARTHHADDYEARLDEVIKLCDILADPRKPIEIWSMERGGGGNWDSVKLMRIADRIGFKLKIRRKVYQEAHRRVRDDKGALELIKDTRNKLAHGELSFSQCGEGVTITDLKTLRDRTVNYLLDVVASFEQYIQSHQFIVESKRPASGGLP